MGAKIGKLTGMETLRPFAHPHRVYCAGPLFNESERREMTEIARQLRQSGFETFVPHADGLEFTPVKEILINQGHAAADVGQWVHEAIFSLDVYQVVVACGSIVCNLNGRTPDEGAVSEIAIAWSFGKPVLLYKDDVRSKLAGRDNPLVMGLASFQCESEKERLGVALSELISRSELDNDWEVPCPPQLSVPLSAGQRFWEELSAFGPLRNADAVADLILEMFGPQRRISAPLHAT